MAFVTHALEFKQALKLNFWRVAAEMISIKQLRFLPILSLLLFIRLHKRLNICAISKSERAQVSLRLSEAQLLLKQAQRIF